MISYYVKLSLIKLHVEGLGRWHESKGRCYTNSCLGDINQDGKVSTLDYALRKEE